MLLEITDICNYACAFCVDSESYRKRNFINKEFIVCILSEEYKVGTRIDQICFLKNYLQNTHQANKKCLDKLYVQKDVNFRGFWHV